MPNEFDASAYLDARRFPLSTQAGLSLDKQQLIDAINLDDLEDAIKRGEPLDLEQQRVYGVLLVKAAMVRETEVGVSEIQ